MENNTQQSYKRHKKRPMSDPQASIFAAGHDRHPLENADPIYAAERVDPRELTATPKKAPATTLATEPEPVQTQQHDELRPAEQDQPAPISSVFDPKNQLASLIKNARQNEQAIHTRNRRIRDAKLESRNRYGW